MPKFNQPAPRPTSDTRTAQGGAGFARDERDELFLLGVANMVGEDTFYETGASRDRRFAELIHKVTPAHPEWMQGFIGWLRTGANMRSASIVAAAEYVRASGPGGRAVVNSALQRADEPAEMLAYWVNTHGRNVPMPVKRGVADAARRLYTERNLLRYDGQDLTWRFADVLELAHPKPVDDDQSMLFKHALDRRHDRGSEGFGFSLPILTADARLRLIPEANRRRLFEADGQVRSDMREAGWDWKRIAGWMPGGMDAAAWEAAIPNMGLMALTRNLRNFDEARISEAAAAQVIARLCDPDEVRRSRQFPIRFLTAWKNTVSMRWGHALETAVGHSVANVPELPGRTLILVDVSPSMKDPATRAHRGRTDAVSPARWEVAALFGAALARRAEHPDVFFFDFNPIGQLNDVNPAESILRIVEASKELVDRGNGTDTLGTLAKTYDGHDRVIIITDEQTGLNAGVQYGPWNGQPGGVIAGWDAVAHVHCPVVTFNLAGYETGHTPNLGNWVTLGGLNDACFGLIGTVDKRNRGVWPWEITEPEDQAQP